MQDEHLVAIVSFEGAVKREVRRVREALRPAVETKQVANAFTLEVTANGRLLDGEVKLEYGISDSEYGISSGVSGDSLQAVLDEFLRRKGWSSVHEAKAITFVRERQAVPSDTEIPATEADDDIVY